MTTMVMSHHVDVWQQRNQPAYNMSNMNLSTLMPPYETPRSVTNPPTSRGYHQTSSVEMSLPLFSASGLTSSVPYQPGSYAFDPVQVNPYDMQQTYSMSYAAEVPQNLSYTRSSLHQQMPALQDARSFHSPNQYSSKSATASPLQSSPSYQRSHYAAELERPRSEPVDSTSINFATDVDTLMRAIQAKQPEPQQPSQRDKVRCLQARITQYHTDSSIGGGNQVQPKAEEEVSMQHAWLQQELLPEDTSRDSRPRTHWCQTLRKPPSIRPLP